MMRIAGLLSAVAVMAQAAEVPSFTNTDDYDELNLNFRFLQKNVTEEEGPKATGGPQEGPVIKEKPAVSSSLTLTVPATLTEAEKTSWEAALSTSTKQTVAAQLEGISEADVTINAVTFSGRRLSEGKRQLSTQTVTVDFTVVPPPGATLTSASFDTAMADSTTIMAALKTNIKAADASIDTTQITGTLAIAGAVDTVVTEIITVAPETTTAAPAAAAPAPAAAAPAASPASNAFTVSAVSAVFLAAVLA